MYRSSAMLLAAVVVLVSSSTAAKAQDAMEVLETVRKPSAATPRGDPTLGKVQFEATYLQWADFNGMKFPTMIVEKENDEISRILIVERVEAGGAR